VIRFRVDDQFILQLSTRLELFRVGSIVVCFLDVSPVKVDSHGLTGLGFMSPQFLCNFSFFLIIFMSN
jgi:hypothetical protein